jgi:hypothetical protein
MVGVFMWWGGRMTTQLSFAGAGFDRRPRRLPWHIAARVIAGCSLLLWWVFILLALSVARVIW